MKTPFNDNCGTVKREGYKTGRGKEVNPAVCDGQVVFQSSLDPKTAVGHCGKCNNTIYKKMEK